jgi:protein TonB
MVSQHLFTNGQWAAALGIALLAHVLLAGSLFLLVPGMADTPVVQGAGLAVKSLSLSGADLPVVRDIAAGSPGLARVTSATQVKAISHPTAPPEVRPMTEVMPVERRRPRANQPTPKTKLKKPPTRNLRKSSPVRKSNADDGAKGNAKGDRAETGNGQKGNPDESSTAGLDRAATPVPGNASPRYPRRARSRGQEGRVVIRISVLDNGRVGSAEVASSSGYSSLDRAALKVVQGWRFKPALRAGKPVTATLTVPVVFRLEG